MREVMRVSPYSQGESGLTSENLSERDGVIDHKMLWGLCLRQGPPQPNELIMFFASFHRPQWSRKSFGDSLSLSVSLFSSSFLLSHIFFFGTVFSDLLFFSTCFVPFPLVFWSFHPKLSSFFPRLHSVQRCRARLFYDDRKTTSILFSFFLLRGAKKKALAGFEP